MPHAPALNLRPARLPWPLAIAVSLALGLAGARAAAQGCAQLVASGNPEYPPYLWRDPDNEGRLIGANAELMQWLSKEIGVPIDVQYSGPWGRVQEETRLGHLDLIAGAFFTLPRTEYMDYFHPAFHETRSVIWTRGNNNALKFRRWSDLVGLQGVTVINNSFGEEFDRYAKDKLHINQVASLEQAIQIVQNSRADYLVYEDSPGQAFLARRNIADVKMLGDPVARENLYLTISHRSACNTPEMRGRIARALYKLSRDKAMMTGFVERALQLWRKQTAKS
ncbi:substrate-binding periplasmic protein [Ideonella sp. YS5]|uniref:substrate-binding periplasmic protein n=1 Tax=Ideonella sp. YS5 TaxID=3453714 RepID=UPI003EEB8487